MTGSEAATLHILDLSVLGSLLLNKVMVLQRILYGLQPTMAKHLTLLIGQSLL